MFRDAAGRDWLRTDSGVLKRPSADERLEHIRQDPSPYSTADEHPTLNLALDEEGKPLA
jgi:hypothetical protein